MDIIPITSITTRTTRALMINERNSPKNTFFYIVFSTAAIFIYIVLIWLLAKSFIGTAYLSAKPMNTVSLQLYVMTAAIRLIIICSAGTTT